MGFFGKNARPRTVKMAKKEVFKIKFFLPLLMIVLWYPGALIKSFSAGLKYLIDAQKFVKLLKLPLFHGKKTTRFDSFVLWCMGTEGTIT